MRLQTADSKEFFFLAERNRRVASILMVMPRALPTLLVLLLIAFGATAEEDPFRDLMADLSSRRPERRREGLMRLLNDPTLVPDDRWERTRRSLLKTLEKDRKADLRGLAARCLALFPDVEATGRILARLSREREWRSQRDMLTALSGFTDEALVALAGKRSFREPRDDVRALWVEALGRSASPAAVAILQKLAGIPTPWPVAQAAALALRRHPSVRTIDALIDLLWSSKPGVRSAAHNSLVVVTGNRDLPEDPPGWVAWWREARDGFVLPGDRPPSPDVTTLPSEPVTIPTYYDIPIRGNRVIFCLDVSASMWGPKIEAAMAELARAVQSLTTRNRFNVIFFNERPYVWRDELIPAYPYQKLECVTSFDDLETKKYTNIYDTLERALGFAGLGRYALADPPGVDDVFILTDGEPNRGRYRDLKGILAGLAAVDPKKLVRIHAISIGDAPKELMAAIAAQQGGRHKHVDARR